jgi:hypothetical protein
VNASDVSTQIWFFIHISISEKRKEKINKNKHSGSLYKSVPVLQKKHPTEDINKLFW